MTRPNDGFLRALRVLFSVLVPIALLLSAMRLVLTPIFLRIEYNTPNFPEDSYGMSKAERLRYAPLAMDFLLNDEDITFLGEQTFMDGTPLYNERELSHMQDVKNLAQALLAVWYASLLLLLGLGLWAWRGNWLGEYKSLFALGGRTAVYVIGAILLFALLSFNVFFTGFHRIFFEGDSWLFFYSDTLIRLFPLRFWRDVVLVLSLLTLGGGAALWAGLRKEI